MLQRNRGAGRNRRVFRNRFALFVKFDVGILARQRLTILHKLYYKGKRRILIFCFVVMVNDLFNFQRRLFPVDKIGFCRRIFLNRAGNNAGRGGGIPAGIGFAQHLRHLPFGPNRQTQDRDALVMV
jgi:hypothetical protein